jgi:hypothetical protein
LEDDGESCIFVISNYLPARESSPEDFGSAVMSIVLPQFHEFRLAFLTPAFTILDAAFAEPCRG